MFLNSMAKEDMMKMADFKIERRLGSYHVFNSIISLYLYF